MSNPASPVHRAELHTERPIVVVRVDKGGRRNWSTPSAVENRLRRRETRRGRSLRVTHDVDHGGEHLGCALPSRLAQRDLALGATARVAALPGLKLRHDEPPNLLRTWSESVRIVRSGTNRTNPYKR